MNKKGISILEVILLILILGLCGFIVYDKGFSNNNTVSNNSIISSKNNIESLEVDDALVISLLKKINRRMDCGTEFSYLRDEKVTAKSFSSEEIYNMALANLFDELGYSAFTDQTLEDEISDIIGHNYDFLHNTYTTCPPWQYNSIEKSYNVLNLEENPCGCTTGPHHTITKIMRAEKENRKINIYQRVIFVDPLTGYGYNDLAKKKQITDLVYENNMGVNVINENLASNIMKGTLYKIVFEESNNRYIFSYSEPIL